jgi:hypothetical protein
LSNPAATSCELATITQTPKEFDFPIPELPPGKAADSPWRFLVRKITLPHIDPCGSRHLAVSNGRLPDPVSRITPDA